MQGQDYAKRDRNVRELGRVSFILIRLKNLNIATEMLLKEKIPSQVFRGTLSKWKPFKSCRYAYLCILIIWVAPWVGKMTQIARYGWLPQRASHLARSGLPAVTRKQSYPESHRINPLLTKFARSKWQDIGLFLRVNGPRLHLGP